MPGTGRALYGIKGWEAAHYEDRRNGQCDGPATVSGKPYELTAETVCPCRVSFVKREDFLRFLNSHPDACIKVAEHLSKKYLGLCREARSLALSDSARQKTAELLVEWWVRDGEASKP